MGDQVRMGKSTQIILFKAWIFRRVWCPNHFNFSFFDYLRMKYFVLFLCHPVRYYYQHNSKKENLLQVAHKNQLVTQKVLLFDKSSYTSLLSLCLIIFRFKYLSPAEERPTNYAIGKKSRMKQLERCFLCGRKERKFLSMRKSLIRSLLQEDLGTIICLALITSIKNHLKIGPLRKLTCECENHVVKTGNRRKNHLVDHVIDSYTF